MHESTIQQREDVARMAGTTIAYLWQIARGHSKPSWRLAERLTEASSLHTPDRIISKYLLRPDIAAYFLQTTTTNSNNVECAE